MSPDAGEQRKFRATDDEWSSFLDATRAMRVGGRSPRSQVIREFIRWYMRRPGAKLPERPPVGAWSEPGNHAAETV